MKKLFKEGQPKINNKSCIIYWDVVVRFTHKEQLTKFIALINKQEMDYNYDVEYNHENTKYWEVTIHDMCWANNLTWIGKLLERVDYHC